MAPQKGRKVAPPAQSVEDGLTQLEERLATQTAEAVGTVKAIRSDVSGWRKRVEALLTAYEEEERFESKHWINKLPKLGHDRDMVIAQRMLVTRQLQEWEDSRLGLVQFMGRGGSSHRGEDGASDGSGEHAQDILPSSRLATPDKASRSGAPEEEGRLSISRIMLEEERNAALLDAVQRELVETHARRKSRAAHVERTHTLAMGTLKDAVAQMDIDVRDTLGGADVGAEVLSLFYHDGNEARARYQAGESLEGLVARRRAEPSGQCLRVTAGVRALGAKLRQTEAALRETRQSLTESRQQTKSLRGYVAALKLARKAVESDVDLAEEPEEAMGPFSVPMHTQTDPAPPLAVLPVEGAISPRATPSAELRALREELSAVKRVSAAEVDTITEELASSRKEAEVLKAELVKAREALAKASALRQQQGGSEAAGADQAARARESLRDMRRRSVRQDMELERLTSELGQEQSRRASAASVGTMAAWRLEAEMEELKVATRVALEQLEYRSYRNVRRVAPELLRFAGEHAQPPPPPRPVDRGVGTEASPPSSEAAAAFHGLAAQGPDNSPFVRISESASGAKGVRVRPRRRSDPHATSAMHAEGGPEPAPRPGMTAAAGDDPIAHGKVDGVRAKERPARPSTAEHEAAASSAAHHLRHVRAEQERIAALMSQRRSLEARIAELVMDSVGRGPEDEKGRADAIRYSHAAAGQTASGPAAPTEEDGGKGNQKTLQAILGAVLRHAGHRDRERVEKPSRCPGAGTVLKSSGPPVVAAGDARALVSAKLGPLASEWPQDAEGGEGAVHQTTPSLEELVASLVSLDEEVASSSQTAVEAVAALAHMPVVQQDVATESRPSPAPMPATLAADVGTMTDPWFPSAPPHPPTPPAAHGEGLQHEIRTVSKELAEQQRVLTVKETAERPLTQDGTEDATAPLSVGSPFSRAAPAAGISASSTEPVCATPSCAVASEASTLTINGAPGASPLHPAPALQPTAERTELAEVPAAELDVRSPAQEGAPAAVEVNGPLASLHASGMGASPSQALRSPPSHGPAALVRWGSGSSAARACSGVALSHGAQVEPAGPGEDGSQLPRGSSCAVQGGSGGPTVNKGAGADEADVPEETAATAPGESRTDLRQGGAPRVAKEREEQPSGRAGPQPPLTRDAACWATVEDPVLDALDRRAAVEQEVAEEEAASALEVTAQARAAMGKLAAGGIVSTVQAVRTFLDAAEHLLPGLRTDDGPLSRLIQRASRADSGPEAALVGEVLRRVGEAVADLALAKGTEASAYKALQSALEEHLVRPLADDDPTLPARLAALSDVGLVKLAGSRIHGLCADVAQLRKRLAALALSARQAHNHQERVSMATEAAQRAYEEDMGKILAEMAGHAEVKPLPQASFVQAQRASLAIALSRLQERTQELVLQGRAIWDGHAQHAAATERHLDATAGISLPPVRQQLAGVTEAQAPRRSAPLADLPEVGQGSVVARHGPAGAEAQRSTGRAVNEPLPQARRTLSRHPRPEADISARLSALGGGASSAVIRQHIVAAVAARGNHRR